MKMPRCKYCFITDGFINYVMNTENTYLKTDHFAVHQKIKYPHIQNAFKFCLHITTILRQVMQIQPLPLYYTIIR